MTLNKPEPLRRVLLERSIHLQTLERAKGRNRRPIKATSIAMDRCRIETHIKPLLGLRLASNFTLRDVEAMQADVAAGKSACGK